MRDARIRGSEAMTMKQKLGSVRVTALGVACLLSFFALGVLLGPSLPFPVDDARTIARFHEVFYYRGATTWDNSRWLGVPIQKCPMDLMAYQELLYETKPDVLIEAGTFKGGSALFFASIMDLVQRGHVITIDTTDRGRPPHPRITYLSGFSTAPEIVSAVRSLIPPGARVMVVLDSDHSAGNVLKELQTYAPLVTKDCYLVVEDTILNGHPVHPGWGPGPSEAVDEFLKAERGFVRERTREKYLVTFNPGGFLRRTRQ